VAACLIESVSDPKKKWTDDIERMTTWLKSLAKPVGVMCCSDYAAMHLTWACAQMGFLVPQQVAVVGVDNDDIQSAISRTPLSSVVLPARQIGRQAAALLDTLLKGARPPDAPILLDPIALITRHSSDVFIVKDPQITRALQFIRDHACESIDVSDIVANVSMSRRSLERAFLKTLNLTPRDQILRVRIERAKSLLAETQWKVEVIALKAGFCHHQTFARLFKRLTDMTPLEYRQKYCGTHGIRLVPAHPLPTAVRQSPGHVYTTSGISLASVDAPITGPSQAFRAAKASRTSEV
jgi:LacI family transcriptional regulator